MVEYFLQLGTPGKDQIVGPSRKVNYVGWIELIGYSMANSGANAGSNSGAGRIGDWKYERTFNCLKPGRDGVSAAIAHAATTGQSFSKAVLASVSRERGKTVRINMRNVVITTFNHTPIGAAPHDGFQLYGVPQVVVGD